MPKRKGFLYEKLNDPDFIRRCILKCARGKRKRYDVRRALADLDGCTARMKEIIENRTFVPCDPHKLTIYDSSSGKVRDISSVKFFPDAVLQVMICEVIMDILMGGIGAWSCASIPGRGGKRVHDHIIRVLENPKISRYALEMDIRHFYLSIPLDTLMESLEHKIKDQTFLNLIALIITETHIQLREVTSWRDLTRNRTGLAIGFYINQWLANYYLGPFDRFLESLPGVRAMTRYMDNIVLIGPDKRKLHRAVPAAEDFLAMLGLSLKPDWQVYPVRSRKIRAVGYRYGRRVVIMRKKTMLRMTRQCRRAIKRLDKGKKVPRHMAYSTLSRMGQLKHCARRTLRKKYQMSRIEKACKNTIRGEA